LNKKRDFNHKLADFYTTEYGAVFVEDFDVRGMIAGDGTVRNKVEVGWRSFISTFNHHGEKNGCHVIKVDPPGTTKECSRCGAEVENPLWARGHNCPSCFRVGRDFNAALDVLFLGLAELGVVHSEGTPVKTAAAVDTASVSAGRVVEARSLCLNERAQANE